MKKFSCLLLGSTLVGSAFGQAVPAVSEPSLTPTSGFREFSLGASGTANHDLDDSSGGLEFDYGYYYSDTLVGLIRQSISYTNPQNGSDAWTGWTRLAVNQHFASGAVRPFLGVNAGRLYGDAVHDTWTAGLEGGFRYYVRPQTFLRTTVEYGWVFNDSDDIDDRFDNGLWNWSVAVGFNF